MATAIYFNGRRINTPQAVSKIDATSLAGSSPASVGIVALVGTAEGGKPLTVDSTYADATRPETLKERFRSGNLLTAGQFCFQPSADPDVPGGAQRIVGVKVNPATQSVATLPDSTPANSVDLTSRDYGLFTSQINVEVAAGTTQGKKITVVFEDQTEVFDNVGGDSVMSLDYTPGSNGWATALLTAAAAGLTATHTKSSVGLDTERTAALPSTQLARVESTSAGDTTQTITIYGKSASNTALKETVTLNGTTPVYTVNQFSAIYGCVLSATAAGTVTVKDVPGTTTVFSLTSGTTTRGVIVLTNGVAYSALTVAITAVQASANIAIFGKSLSGAAQGSICSVASLTSQTTAESYSAVEVIALGDILAARTVTVTATVAVLAATYPTIQKAVDRFNVFSAYTAAALVTNPTTFKLVDLDYFTGSSFMTALNLYANLFEFIDILNSSSQYVTAARATGAVQVPANTTVPVFLSGGVEGTTTITQWQQAFDELKKRRVNVIVPLTEDPAVHALLLAHLVERAGRLRSEANGYVGIGTSGGAGETKTNIKAQIQALGTRHISAVSQEINRYDPSTGEATFYPPWMFAAIAAGMQAGSAIGEPLTYKAITANDLRNDSSWSTIDDAEELIDAGLMMAENVEGIGIRWIRSITTHLADDNAAYSEMSANESMNTAVYRLRTQLDNRVGKRGLASSVNSIKSIAIDELDRMVKDEIIFGWNKKSLSVEQVGDVYPVSVEISPVFPINFIPITVHVVAPTATAA